MKQINRRMFLKEVGLWTGTAAGLSALDPRWLYAAGTTLRYGINSRDIRRLDPMAGPNSNDKTVLAAIFNGLVRTSPGEVNAEKVEPDLAERWESSKDLKTWTFHLRRGVEFHHGYGEFTSADIVFSLDRAKDKKTNVYYKSYGPFGKVEALDTYTVRIHLKSPQTTLSLLPNLLDWQAGMVLSKNAAEKLGDKIKSMPIGTGPYIYEEFIPQERLVLSRNEKYFRGKPGFEKVEFRMLPDPSSRTLAFKSGELEIMDVDREQRAIDQVKGPGVVIESFGPPSVHKLHMDRTRKPLNDLKVRQAIAYAINRDDLVRFIGKDLAEPLYSIIPAKFVGGLDPVPEKLKYNHDPAKAKKLLAEAGLPNGFSIDPVFISERPQFRRPMEIIQNQLAQVGIKINLSVVAHPTWHTKNDEGSNPLVLRAAQRFPTANFVLEEFFLGGGKRNFSHFSGADAELKQAQKETDLEVQKKLWREAQIKILEDMAAYPTHILNTVVARKAKVDLGFNKLESSLSGGLPIEWNARFT